MRLKLTTLILGALMLVGGAAAADQALDNAVGLSMDQSRKVTEITARYRKAFAAKRTERNTELRRLRTARIQRDSAGVAKYEQTTEKMRLELMSIRDAELVEIERHLTPEQRKKFQDFVKYRYSLQGASPDERVL